MTLRLVFVIALVLGLPTADYWAGWNLLGPGLLGRALWAASVLCAFLIGAQAVYVHRKKLDEYADAAKGGRMELRRATEAAMREVSLAYDSLQRAISKERGKPGPDRVPAESQRRRFNSAVSEYWTAANQLPVLEASIHMHIVSGIQEALEEALDLNLLRALDGPLDRMQQLLIQLARWIDEPMTASERDFTTAFIEREYPEWLDESQRPKGDK